MSAAFAPRIHNFDFPSHRVTKGSNVNMASRRIFDWAIGKYRRPRGDEKPQPVDPYWHGSTDDDERGRHGAPPFTRAFEQHLSGRSRSSTMRTVMGRLHRKHGEQMLEWRILFALSSGHTDPDVVCAILGWRRDVFEAAAIRALSLVWDRAQANLARVTS